MSADVELDEPESGRFSGSDRWVLVVFLALICFPAVVMANPFGARQEELSFANWTARPAPPRNFRALVSFPRAYVTYFNASFGLHRELMRAYARLRLSGLAVSDPQSVIVGNDGWLFYSGEGIVNDLRGVQPFSEAELAAWTKLLVTRADWLHRRGIPYVFIIAPNTHTIYPEHLPGWIVRSPNPTRREQLTAYLKAHTDLDVLDPTAALLAAKTREQVCYRTDTHWNMVGGFTAYKEISRWMAPRFSAWRSFGEEDFERRTTPGWRGALGYMLGAPELAAETRTDFVPRGASSVRTDGAPLPIDEIADAWTVRKDVIRESADGELPSAVIFRDSQMAAPAQFLSRHFRKSTLRWSYQLDPALVERERPSVVIQEIVERALNAPIPYDDPLP